MIVGGLKICTVAFAPRQLVDTARVGQGQRQRPRQIVVAPVDVFLPGSREGFLQGFNEFLHQLIK